MKFQGRAKLLAVSPYKFTPEPSDRDPQPKELSGTTGMFFVEGESDVLRLSLPAGMNGDTPTGDYVLTIDVKRFGQSTQAKLVDLAPVGPQR